MTFVSGGCIIEHMTPLTSAEKMSNYRAKLLQRIERMGGFTGRAGQPSISRFETAFANAKSVTVIIDGVMYRDEPIRDASEPEQ